MGVQGWNINSGRSGSIKLLSGSELRLEVKSFPSKEENAKMQKQKKHGEFYNTKPYLEMYISF